METKPAKELHSIQDHEADFSLAAVIFVAKDDLLRGNVNKAVIADGHFVGVPAEILDNGLGTVKRSLGVNHPILAPAGLPPAGCFRVAGRRVRRNGEQAFVPYSHEMLEVECFENLAHGSDGKKETPFSGLFWLLPAPLSG